TSTLSVASELNTKTKFSYLHNEGAISTFSNIVSLEGTGEKLFRNYGTVNVVNNFNAISNGSSTSTVTINNYSVMAVQQFVNASYVAGKVFVNNFTGTLSVNRSISLSNTTNTLTNQSVLNVNEGFSLLKGIAVNSGSITCNLFTNSTGTLNNTNYLRSNTDVLLTNTAAVINNSNTIDVANTFSNIAKCNNSINSFIYTKNYYNTGNSASINGPTGTVANIDLPRIYISDISSNSGIINKSLVLDASLTSTTSNIGFGFDVVSSSTRIASSVVFASKGVSPGNGNPATYSCTLLNYFYSQKVGISAGTIAYGNMASATSSVVLSKIKQPSSTIYTTSIVPSTNYTWMPLNLSGNVNNGLSTIDVSPIINTVYTVSSKYLTCQFNNTLNLNVGVAIKPLIDNLDLNENDSLGNITVNFLGGNGVYTNTWLPGGENTPYLNSIKQGTYGINVTDGNGQTCSKTYSLGYKSVFKDFYGTSFSNDTLYAHSALTPTGSPSAISVNELRPGLNGWVQFVVPTFTAPYILGYLDSVFVNDPGYYYDYDFALHVTFGNNLYIYSSGSFNYLGTVNYGDVLSIHKNGTTFILNKNGVAVATDVANNLKSYKLKVGLNDDIYLNNISLSFKDSTTLSPLSVNAIVNHINPDGVDNSGSINVYPTGGSSPYSYNWQPGNIVTRNLENISAGMYTLTVTDFKNQSKVYAYNMQYKALWTNYYGTMNRNDSLISTNETGFVNRTAISKNRLNANQNGSSEIIMQAGMVPFVYGFVSNPQTQYNGGVEDIDFAIHVTYDNYLYIWNGSWFNYYGTINNGDVLRIERNGSTFYAKVNDQVISSQSSTSSPLRIKGLINGSSIPNLGCSFAIPFDFSIVKDHADYSNTNSGYIGISSSDFLSDYQVVWSDGSTDKTRTDLPPGNYSVSISDNIYGVVYNKNISVGVKPLWRSLKNLNVSSDSIYTSVVDSVGVGLTSNLIPINTSGFIELTNNELNQDLCLGFVGLNDTEYSSSYSLPVYEDSLMERKIKNAQLLMKLAINNSLPYGGTNYLSLSSEYANINLIRIHGGIISLLLNG
ncbi:MAG: hypothetical protein ACK5ZT_10630, partial [Sphingobacteriaceae bacterium]